jgi:phosphoribosylformylglycinamidine cyclo-ligase
MKTYRDSGVDIEAGDRFARFIQNMKSAALGQGIGGFAGGIELELSKYKNPVLMTTADGVGTKLLVAKKLGRYDTVGIDLVAMCVNDLIVCGVKPLIFQDYIACSKINEKTLKEVMTGNVRGCEIAGCKLTGGETAEMPDMYGEDDIDLAGFSAGIGEKDRMLPRSRGIQAGDSLLGLPSTGIHSNGLSLARKILAVDEDWEDLLVPTKIYVKEMEALLASGLVLSAAHITGGGLEGNIRRVIPPRLRPRLTYDWSCPSIFRRIQERGGVSDREMRRTFNLGIGIVLVVSTDSEKKIAALAGERTVTLVKIGRLESAA